MLPHLNINTLWVTSLGDLSFCCAAVGWGGGGAFHQCSHYVSDLIPHIGLQAVYHSRRSPTCPDMLLSEYTYRVSMNQMAPLLAAY